MAYLWLLTVREWAGADAGRRGQVTAGKRHGRTLERENPRADRADRQAGAGAGDQGTKGSE